MSNVAGLRHKRSVKYVALCLVMWILAGCKVYVPQQYVNPTDHDMLCEELECKWRADYETRVKGL